MIATKKRKTAPPYSYTALLEEHKELKLKYDDLSEKHEELQYAAIVLPNYEVLIEKHGEEGSHYLGDKPSDVNDQHIIREHGSVNSGRRYCIEEYLQDCECDPSCLRSGDVLLTKHEILSLPLPVLAQFNEIEVIGRILMIIRPFKHGKGKKGVPIIVVREGGRDIEYYLASKQPAHGKYVNWICCCAGPSFKTCSASATVFNNSFVILAGIHICKHVPVKNNTTMDQFVVKK